MRAWPIRGGWWKRLSIRSVSGALLLLLMGCPGGDGSPKDSEKSNERAATAAPVRPLICAGEAVLSDQPADSGGELTIVEMQAYLLTSPVSNPEGFRSQTVVVDEGLGSFRTSVPASYSPFWRNGTPGDDLLDLAEPRDDAWTEFWGSRIESGGLQTRAISLDVDRSDEVFALLITLTEAEEVTGDALAAGFAETYGSQGSILGESCGVRANGADGAYVEHTIPRSVVGGSVDRTQLQFLIPDPPNNALWGVTCDVPQPMASEVKDECRKIASTFQPLPPVKS